MKDASDESGASFFCMAGYSTTPLQKKLGIKDDMTLYILHAPDNYFSLISPLPQRLMIRTTLTREVDCIHLFEKDLHEFKKDFARCKNSLKKNGMLWVSWPKKTSKIATDLNENLIREFGLQEGLVDVKVCAVDEVWSGLKFVFRLKDR